MSRELNVANNEFLKVAGINCCESKISQKVTLHNFNLNGSFE